jgi:hypothetical protein
MSKYFIRCQLSRSFFPACGLESSYNINISLERFFFFFFFFFLIHYLLQCALDVCLGHAACARLFDDVGKRDVLLGIS